MPDLEKGDDFEEVRKNAVVKKINTGIEIKDLTGLVRDPKHPTRITRGNFRDFYGVEFSKHPTSV
jgi:hypothetical protein